MLFGEKGRDPKAEFGRGELGGSSFQLPHAEGLQVNKNVPHPATDLSRIPA